MTRRPNPAIRFALAAAGLMCLAGGGCVQPPRPAPVDIETLVAEHNANAAAVPRLWARATRITVGLADQPFSWDFTGTLLLAKGPQPLGPHDFVLIGREAGQEAFRVGTSLADGVYYYWGRMGDQAGGAVGRLSLAGAPQLDDLPVDPLQLLAALGVTEMPSDLSTIPTVALSFSDDPSAYVVTYIDRQPITGKILFRREVYLHWHADKPRRPFLVKVFDHRGRRVMTARLDDWQRIDTTTMFDPPDRTPMMPTDIRIDLHPPRRTDQPDRTRIGSIRLRLADMQAEMNDDEESRWDRAAALLWQRLPADLPPESLQPIDAHLSVPAGETP